MTLQNFTQVLEIYKTEPCQWGVRARDIRIVSEEMQHTQTAHR